MYGEFSDFNISISNKYKCPAGISVFALNISLNLIRSSRHVLPSLSCTRYGNLINIRASASCLKTNIAQMLSLKALLARKFRLSLHISFQMKFSVLTAFHLALLFFEIFYSLCEW